MSFISPEDYSTFDQSRIIIESPKQLQAEHGQKFSRLQMKYKYPNGTTGPLVVQTPILFTYGVSFGSAVLKKENAAPQLSLVSYNPEIGPTSEETDFLNVCTAVLNRVKHHMTLETTKGELGKWDMDSDVKAMRLFYVKTEKGRPVRGYPPTLYSKLYYKFEDGETVITSRIADATTGEPLPPKPLLGRGKVYATVIFANVYVGNKPSIQTRIGEIMVVERNDRPCHLKPIAQQSLSEESFSPVLKIKPGGKIANK